MRKTARLTVTKNTMESSTEIATTVSFVKTWDTSDGASVSAKFANRIYNIVSNVRPMYIVNFF